MTEDQRKAKRARWNKWYQRNHKKTPHICPNCDQPFEGRSNQVYCSPSCANIGWKRRTNYSTPRKQYLSLWKDEPAEQIELIPAKKPVKVACTCNDYRHCMECRNREKRRAFKAGEIPVYRVATLAQLTAATD